MKKIIILSSIFLVGCVNTKLIPFPDVPSELLEPAEKLEIIEKEDPQLSDIIKNTAINSGKYKNLEAKYQAWQEWYTKQKRLFDDANERTRRVP